MFATHPELEVHYPIEFTYWQPDRHHTTDIDLIEQFSDHAVHKNHLDHDRLVEHFAIRDVGKTVSLNDDAVREEPTRILFINDLDFSPKVDTDQNAVFEPDTTAMWLQQRFNVTPLFFRLIRELTNPIEGRKAALLNKDKDGKPMSLDGFYTIWLGAVDRNNTIIWFSHNLDEQRSTYIIYNMPEFVKHPLFDLYGTDGWRKGHPPTFALDVLMSRMSLITVQNQLSASQEDLTDMERHSPLDFDSRPDEMVATAHRLAKGFYADRSTLSTVKLVLKFLDGTKEKWHKLKPAYEKRDRFEEMGFDSVQESLEMLLEELNHTATWITNYIDRCSVRINLLFNILTQMDNRTNLGIAEYTSRISESTQRDSSSMITMAVVTMFFLPGTFVSAIFGMSFFEQNSRGDGISVTNDWVLYLFVTIPLTVAVFVVWGLWRKLRIREHEKTVALKRLKDANSERQQLAAMSAAMNDGVKETSELLEIGQPVRTSETWNQSFNKSRIADITQRLGWTNNKQRLEQSFTV